MGFRIQLRTGGPPLCMDKMDASEDGLYRELMTMFGIYPTYKTLMNIHNTPGGLVEIETFRTSQIVRPF